jgi:PAS domain S-box-containing protein
MCALTGYTETALVHLSIADITHPDDVGDALAAVAALVAGERDSVVLETRYVTSTGDCIRATESATLMRRDDGSPHYLFCQLNDSPAARQAERVPDEDHRRLQRATA